MEMKRDLRVLAAAGALLLSTGAASAQKPGGVLKVGWFASPAIPADYHEEALSTFYQHPAFL
jgi:hypothetical protein